LPVCAQNRPNDLILRSDDPIYPTQADMLEYSHKNYGEILSLYNILCTRIIKHFKADKNFVVAFKKDTETFKKYSLIQRDVILPSYEASKGTAYGSNYGIYSDSFLQELTLDKIKNLRNLVQTYCVYNDFNQSDDKCSEESINSLFKI